MNYFDKLLRKPSSIMQKNIKGRYEKFNLKENPFPSQLFVNKDADDDRINGEIFEMGIRKQEYKQIEDNFLRIPRSDPGHLRMGFIMDTSYVRGNGKSAFLINLLQKINEGFCLDISGNSNKCFSVYLSPEPGGRTKTFDKLVDLLFESILSSNIINHCLATIRLEALLSLDPNFNPSEKFKDESDLVEKLNSTAWFNDNVDDDIRTFNNEVLKNESLAGLPKEFPLYQTKNNFLNVQLVTQDKFKEYYLDLKKGEEKLEFIFSHLVDLFLAANFNGAFVLVDDFERIPGFQSPRQKRDFALKLRNCLYDGLYTNAKLGFYTFILALHAGVSRLIQEAWSDSGMENRAPIAPSRILAKHIIPFEKPDREHAVLLLQKYLSKYRIERKTGTDELLPFTRSAIYRIAEISNLNVSMILKFAYDLLDRASLIEGQTEIDEEFVEKMLETNIMESNAKKSIAETETTDLLKKVKGD